MNKTLMANAITRTLSTMFPGYFSSRHKHDHWHDFGFPDNLTFADFWRMYKRNSLGRAGIQRPVEKTWQDFPFLLESEEVHDESPSEAAVRMRFDDLQLWLKCAQADEKSRVGEYGALVLRFADGKRFQEPVERVPGGLMGLVELIPVYQEQLKVSSWDTDELSPNYGHPTMYQFNEAAIQDGSTVNQRTRSVNVHPSRVLVWSDDGTVWGEPALHAGYNDLVSIEKIIGASGEGFWKNAKSAPVLNMDKDASAEALAGMLGVPTDELADKMDEMVGDWQQGFDKMLMFQGISAQTLGVTLPANPEQYLMGALQGFAASVPIPMKILLGSQTGERASTEDANEWDAYGNQRRARHARPNIMRLVRRLVEVGVLQERDWYLDWSDLTESSMYDKIGRAVKMADVNQKLLGSGERAFSGSEIREAVGFEPLDESDALIPDDADGPGFGEPSTPAFNRSSRRRWMLHNAKR